jgi:hypothetical protein
LGSGDFWCAFPVEEIAMWEVWDNNLGDARQDCLNTVRGYPSNYVFAGAIVTYTFSGHTGGLPFSGFFQNTKGDVENAIAGRGYQNVQATISGNLVGDASAVVTAKVPIDQSSVNDVRANFRDAVRGTGIVISSDNLSVQNPSFDQICAGQSSNSPGTSTGTVNQSGVSNAVKSLFDSIGAGIPWTSPLTIGAIVIGAFLLFKR